MRFLARCFAALALCWGAAVAQEADPATHILGSGDVVRITVFQNPDLTLETRVAESGRISYPLIGTVAVGGASVAEAERKIAGLLREGGYVRNPQVNILLTLLRSAQVSVLGQVGRPGRYPIETVKTRLSEMVATAGGVVPGASDAVMLSGNRDGKPIRLSVDLPAVLRGEGEDPLVANGDTLFVDRAPVVYIYGEVQRPGAFRLERGMTLMQGLALGGGLTTRGTERGIRINRRDAAGQLRMIDAGLSDSLERDDVVYVRESMF